MQSVTKSYTLPLFRLTNRKKSLLDKVYNAWQDMIEMNLPYELNRLRHPDIYSKYCSHGDRADGVEQPIILDTQNMFEIITTDNKFCKYFLKIKTLNRKGIIYCPLKTKQKLDYEKIHDSKMVWNQKSKQYELRLSTSKQFIPNSANPPSTILSVDMGEKIMATAVLLSDDSSDCKQPMFMGRKVRGIRSRYAFIRKKLGQKKLLSKIKKISNREQRKVDHILHKTSKDIVEMAVQNNSVILLGDLAGIRNKKRPSKLNKYIHGMPFYKLKTMIQYKAMWSGVFVFETREWYSSKICKNCGSDQTTRPYQGLFKCKSCKHQYNADYNGASNLGKRLWKYIFHDRVLGHMLQSSDRFLGYAASVS